MFGVGNVLPPTFGDQQCQKILRIEESHKKSISSNTCKVTGSPKRESDCIHSLCVLLIQVVVPLLSLSGLLWITVSLDYL